MTRTHEVNRLVEFINHHPRLTVLTGAGISLASGLPTYRDQSGKWLYKQPITHQAFVSSTAVRRRYWHRSMNGWPAVRDARPNAAHRALALLERHDLVEHIITQNVDRLHQRSGSVSVTDLHGRVDRVRCMDCNTYQARESLQQELAALGYRALANNGPRRPDGDVAVEDDLPEDLAVPSCQRCQGMLIPDVIFYGGTVPAERVAHCQEAVSRAQALLVVGSSLQVYSGFRFCRAAAASNKAIAIINPGQTRADTLATEKFATECGPLLQVAAERLTGSGHTQNSHRGGGTVN